MAGTVVARFMHALSWTGLAAMLCLSAAARGDVGQDYSDDDVKAAFVLRFTSYVSWPSGEGNGGTLDIAVLGAPRIAAKLRELQAARGRGNRVVSIRSISRFEEARGARVLYVAAGRRIAPATLQRLSTQEGVLVITDTEHGLSAGGTINFLTVDRRVRFEVSLEAARRADVRISSELLAVAARVLGGRGGTP